MVRGIRFAAAAASGLAIVSGDPCDTSGPSGEQIDGPDSPDDFETWMDSMQSLRESCLDSIGYNASIYDVEEIQWTQTAFMQPQMHPYDRFFYEPSKGYDVTGWLSDLNARYGGIDAALIWPTYTNIGIDDRSQFQQITSMPGGIDAITKFSKELKAAGVRVLWPYNPWDTGTHRDEQGRTDAELLAWLCNATNTDGFNGDTMGSVSEEFYQASIDVDHPIGIEPEGGGIAQSLNWDTMGWGYWNYGSVSPPVSKWKWLETRFMTNVCDRWNKNKTNNLQYAWFNGAGYETWENVWGTWNEIVPADGEAIRRVGTMLRFFGARGFTTSPGWVPHTPAVVQNGSVFASEFPLGVESLFTLVNRGGSNSTGAQLALPAPSPTAPALHYYDCYHGTELKPVVDKATGRLTLSFDIEVNGYGCVFTSLESADTTVKVTPETSSSKVSQLAPVQPATLEAFLTAMRSMTARALSSYRKEWTFLLQDIVPSPTTKKSELVPLGMKRCPGGLYHFKTQGVEIEGGPQSGVDTQFAWEMRPSKFHDSYIHVDTFDIDEYPVTVEQYATYLEESKYLPKNAHNWLKDKAWRWPAGKGPIVGPYGHGPATVAPKVASIETANRPVVHVSIAEARAYCAHYGKRLPQVWEWQYAAQGGDPTNIYPWGTSSDPDRFPSTVNTDTETPARVSVKTFGTKGQSKFGVKDLVGNVWQYTSEVQDIHTRGVLLKGSANYRPDASHWYFPQALELNTHNKYFLMDDSYERSATVGFRCAADAPTKECTLSAETPLCGKVDYTPGYVDLTALGSSDWVHFGDDALCPTCGTKKAKSSTKATLSSNLTVCDGCELPTLFNNNPAAFSWTDGPSSLASAANTTTGVFTASPNSSGAAFGSITATVAEGETATLDLFLGLFGTTANLTATLIGETTNSTFTEQASAGSDNPVNLRSTLRFKGPATLVATWETVAAPACTENLCLSTLATQQCGSSEGSQIDLTTEGHDDWLHFVDDVSGDGVNRKATGGSSIQAKTLDGQKPKSYSNDATTFSWEDGDSSKPSASGVPTGVYVEGQNQGFSITVPVGSSGSADVQVWLGTYNSDGFFAAELSDGSAPAVNGTVSCHEQTGNEGISLQIKNATPGSTVTVTFTQTSDEGNITLQAVAVSSFADGEQQKLGDDSANVNFQAATISVA